MDQTRLQRRASLVVFVLLMVLIGRAQAQQAAGGAERGAQPAERVARYRPLGPAATTPAVIPPVLLSKEHEALCVVRVGDALPSLSLNRVGGRATEIRGLFGRAATVVAFWKSNRRASRTLLADLGPDVVEPFGEKGVAVVGVAVEETAESAAAALERGGATFPNLVDADGKAFAQVGRDRLPRVYLVDPQGKILWFDIEYSLATRRELNQAIRAVTTSDR